MTAAALVLALAALAGILAGRRMRQTIMRRRKYAAPRMVDYRALPRPKPIERPPVYVWPNGRVK